MNVSARKLRKNELEWIMVSAFKGKESLVKQGRTIMISVPEWVFSIHPYKGKSS